MKTIEEMHTMTMEELREYRSMMLSHRCDISTIYDYRARVGDDNNPYLLEAKNATIEPSTEEE
jgi:hypothetical protein|tara:strand:+ start:144 stop:332 length:189 start_codon:yes stop_codon:yes gene_type:complete